MPRTLDQVIAWAHANHVPHQGGTWSERCEQFVNNAGGFSVGFASALIDRQAAERSPLYVPASALPIEKVPEGWLLFWDYNPFGHVAFKVPGGRALMASNYVTDPIAPALGYIPAAAYQQASGHRYLGASPYHGTETIQGVPMSLLTPADISAIAQAVWKQALNDKQTGTHQASTFVIWGSRPTVASSPAPAAAPAAAPTHAELVAALTDPTVQAALGATLAKHLPTKITGTLAS